MAPNHEKVIEDTLEIVKSKDPVTLRDLHACSQPKSAKEGKAPPPVDHRPAQLPVDANANPPHQQQEEKDEDMPDRSKKRPRGDKQDDETSNPNKLAKRAKIDAANRDPANQPTERTWAPYLQALTPLVEQWKADPTLELEIQAYNKTMSKEVKQSDNTISQISTQAMKAKFEEIANHMFRHAVPFARKDDVSSARPWIRKALTKVQDTTYEFADGKRIRETVDFAQPNSPPICVNKRTVQVFIDFFIHSCQLIIRK